MIEIILNIIAYGALLFVVVGGGYLVGEAFERAMED